MPIQEKPWELKKLEARPDTLLKAKRRGQDINAEIQRAGLTPISEGESPLLDWGRIRKRDDFYALIIREFDGLGFLYKPDLMVVGQTADCLERYHLAQDNLRGADDPEDQNMWATMARKEAELFLKLSTRIGLDPQSRGKLTLNQSMVESLRRERYDWDE